MKYSEIALKVLAAKECGIIKNNELFWKQFSKKEKIEDAIMQNNQIIKAIDDFEQQFNTSESDEGFICAFDSEFPIINQKVKRKQKPFLLFYKGDITLLNDLNKNVTVIGLVDPKAEIEKREVEVVNKLVNNGLIIVSGLAKGCDTIAHKVCVDTDNKTIAVLPSQINKISPAVNRNLAKQIIAKGGLLLTEYYKEPINRYEAIRRYIDRDRLQAMFSKAVILIASYRKNEGDSGARHAMEAAKQYEIARYAMFNKITDADEKQFGLNQDLINSEDNCAKVLLPSSIELIKKINLVEKSNIANCIQMTLFDDE